MTKPLIQELVERDKHYPWRILTISQLLSAAPSINHALVHEFFKIVPTPEAMMVVEKEAIDHILRPLGFHNRRFITLCRMTRDYLNGRPYKELYGVGPHSLDSIDLFVRGHVDGLNPHDPILRPYLQRRRAGESRVLWDEAGHHEWRSAIQ